MNRRDFLKMAGAASAVAALPIGVMANVKPQLIACEGSSLPASLPVGETKRVFFAAWSDNVLAKIDVERRCDDHDAEQIWVYGARCTDQCRATYQMVGTIRRRYSDQNYARGFRFALDSQADYDSRAQGAYLKLREAIDATRNDMTPAGGMRLRPELTDPHMEPATNA